MKYYPLYIILSFFLFSACSTVQVASDYDKAANFNSYRTFAFYKPGIDKAEISDLDKKRVLRSIERSLLEKGMSKSQNPDVLISIFTKTRENINVYQNNFGGLGYGWGWSPWYWGGWGAGNTTSVSSSPEGTLYVDLIDADKKELVWQGIGTGVLTMNVDRKQKRIDEIVTAIFKKYPPEIR